MNQKFYFHFLRVPHCPARFTDGGGCIIQQRIRQCRLLSVTGLEKIWQWMGTLCLRSWTIYDNTSHKATVIVYITSQKDTGLYVIVFDKVGIWLYTLLSGSRRNITKPYFLSLPLVCQGQWIGQFTWKLKRWRMKIARKIGLHCGDNWNGEFFLKTTFLHFSSVYTLTCSHLFWLMWLLWGWNWDFFFKIVLVVRGMVCVHTSSGLQLRVFWHFLRWLSSSRMEWKWQAMWTFVESMFSYIEYFRLMVIYKINICFHSILIGNTYLHNDAICTNIHKFSCFYNFINVQ